MPINNKTGEGGIQCVTKRVETVINRSRAHPDSALKLIKEPDRIWSERIRRNDRYLPFFFHPRRRVSLYQRRYLIVEITV